jgi:ankyrin repeat protein
MTRLKAPNARGVAVSFLPATAALILIASCGGGKTSQSSDQRTLHLVEAQEKERMRFCVGNEQAVQATQADSATIDRYNLACSHDMFYVRSALEEACAKDSAGAPKLCSRLTSGNDDRLVETPMDIAAYRERPDWSAPDVDQSQDYPTISTQTTVAARRGNIKVTLTLTSVLLFNQGQEAMEAARWTTKILGQDLSGDHAVVLPAIQVDVNAVGKVLDESRLLLIYRTKDGKLWRLGEWSPVQDGKSVHLMAVPKAAKDWEMLQQGGAISLALEAEDPSDNYSVLFSTTGQRETVRAFLKAMPYTDRVMSYRALLAPEKSKEPIWRGVTDRLQQTTRRALRNLSALSGSGSDLIAAAVEGDAEMASALLNAGVDPDATDVNGATPLIVASANGHLDIVRLLLERGAGALVTDKSGATALMYAAERGHDKVVSELLRSGARRTINYKDSEGWTALMFASRMGRRNIVLSLIKEGASLNAQQDQGATAMILAAAKGHDDIVRDLYYAGADQYLSTPEGTTTLSAAAAYKHKNIASFLAEKLALDLM